MEVVDVPEPAAPGPGEVIVHPDAVGICGSDFHFFSGELQIFEDSPYPRIQGHEFTGTIEQLGPETSGRLSVGDRVSILPLSNCGECYPCRVGRGNVCDNFSLIGIHTDGGLQEKLTVPESQVFAIATDEPAMAALAEPFSIGVRTVHRARIEEGERVVILGAGPIGQASTCSPASAGPRLCWWTASRAGSTSEPPPAPRGCSGRIATRSSRPAGSGLAARARPGDRCHGRARSDSRRRRHGRLGGAGDGGRHVGRGGPAADRTFTEKEVDLLGVSCCGPEEFTQAVRFVEGHEAQLAPLISRRFSLEQAPEALAYAMENPAECDEGLVITSN